MCGFKIYIGIFVSRVSFSCLHSRITLIILSIFRAWVQILHFQEFRCVYTEETDKNLNADHTVSELVHDTELTSFWDR